MKTLIIENQKIKKNGMVRKLLVLCVCIGFAFAANAQTEDKKWNVGVHFGVTKYNGDLGRSYYSSGMTNYGFGGISVSRYLGKMFDANVLLYGFILFVRLENKMQEKGSETPKNVVRVHLFYS